MRRRQRHRPSVLLGSASAGGTIAAVRHLAANGIDVNVINSRPLGAAAWSRFATHTYAAPDETENALFLDRLLAIGKSDPGQVLLPTSDETAWLYTVNAPLLHRHFRLYQPEAATVRRVLDKVLFADAARQAGLSVLPSWDPQNLAELAALAPALPYPVLIKPRTHVHRIRNDKGVVVHSPEQLLAEYPKYIARERYRPTDAPTSAHASRPVIQRFVRVGSEGVLSITGFVDRSGDLFVSRRSTKVFQRSYPVGVGVCYESRPGDPGLSSAVHRLCGELRHFGIFEVEFVWSDGRWAAIDFNPRMFNQMGMDLRRGMPLPLLAYLDAVGETDELRAQVTRAREEDAAPVVFTDGFTRRAILAARALCLSASPADLACWRTWARQHADHTVDLVTDASDPMPAVIHALSELYLGFRAAPRFLRTMVPLPPALAREM